jgi:hypothetical protein
MFEEDRLRDAALRGLDDAKKHREAGDEPARLAALEAAVTAASALADGPLLAASCWRLAKARFDGGDDTRLLEALRPLLAHDVEERSVWGIKQKVGPFDHYVAGLRALPAISRRHWDAVGYADGALGDFWRHYIAWYEEREDPFLAAWGHVHLAWEAACRGELDDVRAMALKYARLSPNGFGQGEHRHPRAVDGPTSVWWVQMDLHRTWLRVATWTGAERSAWEARELLEDAAEDAELDRTTDFWFLDAVQQAAHRFGWTDVPEAQRAAYAAHLPTLPEFHRARADAHLARVGGADPLPALTRAWSLAPTLPGPEWIVDVARQAAEVEPSWAERGAQEAARTGVFWSAKASSPAS